MRRGMVVIAALAVAAVRGASQSVPKAVFAQPVVALRDVRLAAEGLSGGTLDVLLKIYNPNAYDLDVSQMTYTVSVDSSEVGSGHTAQRVMIKAHDSSMVHLPVDFTWTGAAAAARLLTANGYVPYEVKGTIQAARGAATLTIPFDQRGRFRSLQQSR
jgi:LEA14-like dessication related protein